MEFVGRKVKVSLSDSSVYDGYLHSVDSALGKLTLEKVVCTDQDGEKSKLAGLQNIFNHEITDIFVAEEVIKSRTKEPVVDKKINGGCVMKPKRINPHLDRLGVLDPKKLTLKNMKAEDGMNSSGNEDTVSSDADEDVISTENYTVIGKLNDVFHDAIGYISKHLVIGMAMEGVCLGRNGKLCWVQIALPGHVIVFDILRLGKAAFTEGLKAILEAGNILKVFHDCRMVSDIMFHQYGINLTNVFDTQVANVFVYRLQHHNDWPRYVHGLASSLIEHLNLDESQVNWAVVREGFRESDEEVWLQRPLKRNHLEALRKNVIHLLDLRQVLMEKMMEEYVAGVNIYLSHARDASNGDVQKCQKMSYLLPSAFQDVHMFMRSSKNPYFRQDTGLTDVNGFRENYSPIKHPKVIFSRDSLWHMGFKKPGSTAKSSDEKENGKSVDETGNSNDTKKPTNHLSRYASQLSHLLSKCNKEDSNPLPPSSQSHDTSQNPSTSQSPSTAPDQRPTVATSQKETGQQDTKLSALVSKLNETKQEQDMLDAEMFSQSSSNHVTEAVELMNREERIKSPSQSTSQGSSHEDSHQSVPKLQQESPQSQPVTDTLEHQEQLSGSRLMRALINKQAPPGSETDLDLDHITFMPAGKFIERNIPVRKKRPQAPQAPVQQLDTPMFTPGMKRLTQQEMDLVNKIGKRDKRKESESPPSHTDSIMGAGSRRDGDINSVLRNGRLSGHEEALFNAGNGLKYPQTEHMNKSFEAMERKNTENQHKEYKFLPWKQHSSSHMDESQESQFRKSLLPSNLSAHQISASSEEEAPSRNITSPVSGRLQALMQVLNKQC